MGLPGIILHCTATLALAVSTVLRREDTGGKGTVLRIACRFSGMVRLPSTLTVRARAAVDTTAGRQVHFDAITEDGRPAVADGCLLLAS